MLTKRDMQDMQARTWNHLNELLYKDSWNERLRRFRPTLAYRGQGDARGDLRSRLLRLGDSSGDLEKQVLLQTEWVKTGL